MWRSAERIGIDGSVCRADGICDAGTYTSVKAARIQREMRCPECRHGAHVHSSQSSAAHHAPYAGKPCLITLKKRRYRCPSREKTFAGGQPLLSRLTPHASRGLEAFVQDELERGRTIAELERMTGASENVIAKLEAGAHAPKRYLPHDLCVDEARAFPKKAALRRGEPHMACCIYDAGKKAIVDMLAGDDPKTVREHLESFAKGERDAVETVSCDLPGSYIHLAEELLPKAVIYADKFHVSKLVTGAVDDVRKRLSRAMADDEGCKEQRRALRRASKLMLTRKAKLKTERQRVRAKEALEIEGAGELRRAHLAPSSSSNGPMGLMEAAVRWASP